MNLKIDKSKADKSFVEDLIERIKRDIIIGIDGNRRKIDAWQEYINNNIKLFSYSLSSINLYSVLFDGVDSIEYRESQYDFTIEMNKKEFIYGVYVSVYEICKLINYGNLSLAGTQIFSQEFEKTKKDLDKLIELYYSGELI